MNFLSAVGTTKAFQARSETIIDGA